jgi:hypothetical protein
VGKTIQVTRSTVESARLLVETADTWGQPVPEAIRAIAHAGQASVNGAAPQPVSDAERQTGAADRQRGIRLDVERLVRDIEVVERESPEVLAEVVDMLGVLQRFDKPRSPEVASNPANEREAEDRPAQQS